MFEDIVIKLINKLLINSDNCKQLSRYANQCLIINVKHLIGISLVIDEDGLFKKYDKNDISNELVVESFFGVISNTHYFDKLKYISINGDKKTVLDILKILSTLTIYDLYIPNNVVSQIVFSNCVNLLSKFIAIMKDSYESLIYSMGEYLQYEKDIIVTKYEVNKFCDEVDEFNAKVIQLSKKITILEKIK